MEAWLHAVMQNADDLYKSRLERAVTENMRRAFYSGVETPGAHMPDVKAADAGQDV